MYSVVIVDDEKHQQDHLAELLQKHFPLYSIAAICSSVPEGVEKIKMLKPHLVFLDVVMPPYSGFDLLEQITVRNFDVIFCTSFDTYAVRAFKVSAMDYLLKPFGLEELKTALQKFEEKNKSSDRTDHIELMMQNLKQNSVDKAKIALPTMKGFIVVKVADIVRCEGNGSYMQFFLIDKRTYLVSKNIKESEELLIEYDFFRVHTSHLINMRYITEYIKGEGGQVKLADGKTVDVSRRRKDDFLKLFRKL